MSMTHEQDVLKSEKLAQQKFTEMQEFIRLAAKDGRALQLLERALAETAPARTKGKAP